MREVIITPNSFGSVQKNQFFEGQSWFKFSNLRLVLGMTLKIYSCVKKRLKLKVLQETSGEPFCTPPAPRRPPPILNRAKGKSSDSCSVETMKKEKQVSLVHWQCGSNLYCHCIILENMFRNIKSAVFTYRAIGEGERAVGLAYLQMLNISLCKMRWNNLGVNL